MRLRHGRLGAIQHILNELFCEWHLHIGAIEVVIALLIRPEEVITAVAPLDVHDFSDFDVAVRARDEQAHIILHAQTRRREPIHADVTRSRAAA